MFLRKCTILIIAVSVVTLNIADCSGRQLSINKIASSNKQMMYSSTSFGSRNHRFSFVAGARTFLYNNILMPLGFPVVQRGNTLCIDEIDYESHIKPLLPATRHKYKPLQLIALDAGHGGDDYGAISYVGGLQEKLLTMDVCRKVAALLRKHGYQTILVRTEDRKVPLQERSRIANMGKADLFICVHFNSASNRTAHGIETYILTPANQSSSNQKPDYVYKSVLDGNQFDSLNVLLGYHLQSSLISATSGYDRGVKHNHFIVLKGLQCPGALIECGFLSNLSESKKIASPQYRDNLARAISDGIIAFDRALHR